MASAWIVEPSTNTYREAEAASGGPGTGINGGDYDWVVPANYDLPSIPLKVTAIASDYTALSSDEVIEADCTGGAITVTLFPMTGNEGRELTIRKVDSSGNALVIDGSGVETINGDLTMVVGQQYDAPHLYVGKTEWGLR